jgi:formylglycine-generating enzyme required for sulfatase activity
VHVRPAALDVDRLVEAFDATDDSLLKGHLALLLSETRDSHVAALLQSQLDQTDGHVRYLSALALAMLRPQDRHDLDASLMAEIPKGTFTYGDGDGEPIETEAFAIDRFPLTNGQFRHFIEAGGYSERRYWSDDGWQWKASENISGPRYLDDEIFGRLSFPVLGLSWYEAEAYANWAGKRLPTEQEWERAARGDADHRDYPWGSEFKSSRANIDEEIDSTTPVGSYPDGISPYGLYDMAGNVWEWTDSFYDNSLRSRVLRGGSWFDARADARCSQRGRVEPRYRDYAIGVRLSRTL